MKTLCLTLLFLSFTFICFSQENVLIYSSISNFSDKENLKILRKIKKATYRHSFKNKFIFVAKPVSAVENDSTIIADLIEQYKPVEVIKFSLVDTKQESISKTIGRAILSPVSLLMNNETYKILGQTIWVEDNDILHEQFLILEPNKLQKEFNSYFRFLYKNDLVR